MSRRMFLDDRLEQHYQEKGYVLIDFVDKEKVAELKSLYDSYYSNLTTGFFASQYDPNDLSKRDIYQSILKICAESMQQYFYETEPFIASFLVKKANSSSEVSPHLDWTFVDETQYSTVTIWCPLVDCSAVNGTLEVVEGSHQLMRTLRGSPQLPFAYSGYDLYQFSKLIPVRAGQAVVYNHNLIHASKDNKSTNDRVAIGIGLKPREAPLFHIHQTPEGKLKKYTADAAFFHNFSYGSTPDEQFFVEEIEFDFEAMDEATMRTRLGFDKLVSQPQPTSDHSRSFLKSLWQKIFS